MSEEKSKTDVTHIPERRIVLGESKEYTPEEMKAKAQEIVQETDQIIAELKKIMQDENIIHSRKTLEYVLKDKQSYRDMWDRIAKQHD